MTSELRPAVAVWADALLAQHEALQDPKGQPNKAAAAVIEAYGDQREAKWKALAETLAGALEAGTRFMPPSATVWHREAAKALREYKEARDAS